MRVLLASIMHEADTFSPSKTTLECFRDRYYHEGQEIFKGLEGTNTELWGFTERLRLLDASAELIPTVATSAVSGGALTRETFEALEARLVEMVEAAGDVDGVFMAMHGAMVAEAPDAEDATGLLIRRVRERVGVDVPIVVTLDLHANVTERMVSSASALIGYRTWPHVDQAERGAEAAELLLRAMRGEAVPVTSLCKMRMILQVENGQTRSGPMADLLSVARKWEEQGEILSGSVFLVQPWLDIPVTGCAVVVVTDGRRERGQELADTLGRRMWAKRGEFDIPLASVEEAVGRAASAGGRPVVLADPADATGSGATGDSTGILRGLLDLALDAPSILTVTDPEAVEAASRAGTGGTVRVRVGGKRDRVYNEPVEVEAQVEYTGEPSFRFKGPFQTGVRFNMGPVAVLRVGGIAILVSDHPQITVDPEIYRAVGLEPTEAQIVVVKSPNLFRAAYEPIAHEIIVVNAPGLASPDIGSLPFRNLPRPFYPFDRDWDGAPA